MSHYAYVNPYTHIVEKVIVIEKNMIDSGDFGDPENFIECSYTGNFPGIGYHYLKKSFNSKVQSTHCFIPPSPNPNFYFHEDSWSWNPICPIMNKYGFIDQVKKLLLDFFSKN